MASETDIVNAALRKVGDRRITDISDTVASAGIARDVLASERDDLLRSHPWNFATTRVQLAQLESAPAFEFDYAFGLPSDFMRLISVHDSDAGGGSLLYKFESVQQADESYVPAILCNSNIAYLRYVRAVTDTNVMTPGFRQVLTLRLAVVFATGIANSNSLHESLRAELDAAVRKAVAIDGIEDVPDLIPAGSWVTSRHAYGWARRDTWS